jgi:hypothetical protein
MIRHLPRYAKSRIFFLVAIGLQPVQKVQTEDGTGASKDLFCGHKRLATAGKWGECRVRDLSGIRADLRCYYLPSSYRY